MKTKLRIQRIIGTTLLAAGMAHAQVNIEDSITAAIAAADNGTGARASSYTLTSTVQLAGFDPAGAHKLLLTVSAEGSGNPRTLTATYGGAPMNQAVQAVNPNRNAYILYLDLTSPIGAGDLQLNFSGDVNGVGISLLALSGTAEGFGSIGTSTNNAATLATTAADSLIVAATAANGNTVTTANSPLAQLFSGQVGSAVGASGHQSGGSSGSSVTSAFSINTGTATAAVEILSASTPPSPPPFKLTITPNGTGFDFSWPSQTGKVYDLVTSTDLATPVASWTVYDDGSAVHGGLAATPPTNTLMAVPGSGPRRLFAVIEKDPVPSPVEQVRVFLVGGQSNADGRADTAGLPTSPVNLQLPQDDIDFYYKVEGGIGTLTTLRPGLSETSQFGPAITFGRAMADGLLADGTTTRVALIKYANGGTNLATHWIPGGDGTVGGDGPEYVIFQQTVASGMAALASAYPGASIAIEGMIWLQGESDISFPGGPTAYNNYQTNLTNFIADVRATISADLPFIVIRLSDGQTALDATGLEVVRTAQQTVADADILADWVNTDGFGMKGDNLHFDAAGQQSIGTAAADRMLLLVP
jgi:hypothetical protein